MISVLLLAGCLGGTEVGLPGAPVVNVIPDESQGRLVIQSADSRADWDRLAVSVSLSGSHDIRMGNLPTCNLNGRGCQNLPASAQGVAIPSSSTVQITSARDAVEPEDFLELCSSSEATTFVMVRLHDTTGAAAIGEWTFRSIERC